LEDSVKGIPRERDGCNFERLYLLIPLRIDGVGYTSGKTATTHI